MHVSTDEVYGSVSEGFAAETAPLDPSSPYSSSKAGSDLLALSYATTFGYDVIVTRCTNNYGPYQFPEKVIPLFVTNLLEGKKVPLYGDGRNERDWLHVDDHNAALHLLVDEGARGEIYNIGAGAQLSNLELTHRILDAQPRGELALECGDLLSQDEVLRIQHPAEGPGRLAHIRFVVSLVSPHGKQLHDLARQVFVGVPLDVGVVVQIADQVSYVECVPGSP